MQLFTIMELGAVLGLGFWILGWMGGVGGLVGTWGIKVACRNWIPNSGCHLCFGEVCVYFFSFSFVVFALLFVFQQTCGNHGITCVVCDLYT